jgi:hypothetical protein
MPRNYVKKGTGTPIDHADLVKALKEVKIEKKSGRTVATNYNIPKINLYRYIDLLDKEFPDLLTPLQPHLKTIFVLFVWIPC